MEICMNMKRFAPLAIIVVLLGGTIWYVAARDTQSTETTTVETTASPASEVVTYQGQEGKNALEVLKSEFTVTTEETSFGEMVQSINGLAADDSHYWALYVNGEMASVGAADIQTTPSDTIEWRYTGF